MGADINSTKPDDTPPFIIFGGGLAGGEVKVGEKDLRFLPAFVTSAPHAKEKVVFNMPARADVFMDPVEEVLSAAGIKLVRKGKKLLVANQRYRTFTYEVRREVAGVAPLMVAQLLAGEEVKIRIEEVYPRDEVFLKILEDLGVRRSKSGKRLRLWTQKLRGAQVDLSLTPELLPFVATVACMAKGRTIIRNASEARDMKSDRINAMATELKKIGAKVLEQGDGMLVQGPVQFRGGEVDGHADYAVTASLAVASLFAKERVLIKNGPEALRTAYPQFLSSFREIGAQVSHQS
jgi:3-phosphoshikimate 1-carboxyvinyltransferase